jgi:hypothetical protein
MRVLRKLRALGVLAILPLCASAGWEEAWEGRYALELRVASVARVPVVGAQRSVTRSLLLVDVERQGGRLMQRQRVCHIDIQSPRVRMTVPEAYVRALQPREYPAEIRGDEGARSYTADSGMDYVGYDPRFTGGALPANRTSPGVLDSDRDGEPGATVVGHFPLFGSVRMFVAQRSHLVLRGRRVAADRVEGRIEVLALEQRMLGASNRLFNRDLTVQPDPSASGFTMVRAPLDDCGALVRRASTLFPRGS